MKKWCASFILLLLVTAASFAKGGVLAGAGKLSVFRTQYFDIIYPTESKAAAEKIAAVADGYYEEICTLLQTDCYQRFPVTITHSVEDLNAYFTILPYNRIVLYDTPPDTALDQSAESITAVFYHELTHAVTANMKSKVRRFLSGVFGDWVYTAMWTQTSFMLEGAAVSFESLGGEGRVNDPYSTQLVVQAKLDGQFPSWRDVTGARDIFPGGTDAYAFGALFCHYLQETYGMEKYAVFWELAGNGKGFKRSIKEVYGKSIGEEWKRFQAWVPVPSVAEAVQVDFVRQPKRAVYNFLETNAHGAAWYEAKTGGVWYAAFSENGAPSKPKKLFTCQAATRLSLSDDGRYLAVSYLYAKQNTKAAVCVYDFARKKLLSLPLESVRDAGFVRAADGSLQLACVDIAQSQQYALNVYTVGARAKDFVLQKRIPFAAGELPFSPCAAANGGFACIVKSGLEWNIRLYTENGYRAYGATKTILHHLHSMRRADGRLAFSFSYAALGATDKMLPRAGLLYVNPTDFASELVLQNDDVSGGVLNAALFPATSDERFISIGAFYDTQRLMQLDFSARKLIRHKGRAPEEIAFATAEDGVAEEEVSAALELPETVQSISYNPLRYYKHMMFLPIGIVNSYDRDELDEYIHGYSIGGSAWVGATFASSNPWGDRIFLFSGGWNPIYYNGGLFANYSGGTDTFSYDVNGTVLFDAYGFMQTTDGISLSKTLYSRFGKSVSVGAKGAYFYGHDTPYDVDDGDEEIRIVPHEKDWAGRAQGYALFSTVRKMSPRYANYGGVYVQPYMLYERVLTDYVNAGATVGARIPGLFPLSLSATLFPSSSYVASATVSVVLFSWETQKGIPIALYADRIYLSAAYMGKIAYRCDEYFDIQRLDDIVRDVTKDDYSDTVQLKLGTVSAINAGFLTNAHFDVGAVFQYHPNPKKNEDDFSFGVTASIVY